MFGLMQSFTGNQRQHLWLLIIKTPSCKARYLPHTPAHESNVQSFYCINSVDVILQWSLRSNSAKPALATWDNVVGSNLLPHLSINNLIFLSSKNGAQLLFFETISAFCHLMLLIGLPIGIGNFELPTWLCYHTTKWGPSQCIFS